ncbi:MAG TPA: acyltransferase [Candidatus Polarisedimenticolaceae bacterium]|nr:acyltransferase [Candidatus Polarisedimenticolaceae bacterium]
MTEKPSAEYRPELDGLRFFAFFAVFLHHALAIEPSAWQRFGVPEPVAGWLARAAIGGAYGVDLFFVLSAYLITYLLVTERARTGRIDVPRFYIRRALRIWPLYFVFLLLTVEVAPWLIDEALPASAAVCFWLFVGNWWIVARGYPLSVATVLWSVSIEEQFYAVQPWLARIVHGRRQWIALVALLLAAATAMRLVLISAGAGHPRIWCNTLARLDPIAAGALAAILVPPRRWRPPPWSRAALVAGGALGLLFAALCLPLDEDPFTFRQLIGYPLVAAACLAVLLGSLGSTGVLTSRPLVYLGRISYGLYVFHTLGLQLAGQVSARLALADGARTLAIKGSLGLLVTIGLAALSYRYLERPFLRLKPKFSHVISRPEG